MSRTIWILKKFRIVTVKVLGLCPPCDAFLRGSLNNRSVPDMRWSRQCVKRNAESATSEKTRLNMASQKAATKNINFNFARLSLHNHTADKQAAVHTTAHSNVIRLPSEWEGFGRKPTRSISKHQYITSRQWESWVGITDDRSGIRTDKSPKYVHDKSATSPLFPTKPVTYANFLVRSQKLRK